MGLAASSELHTHTFCHTTVDEVGTSERAMRQCSADGGWSGVRGGRGDVSLIVLDTQFALLRCCVYMSRLAAAPLAPLA